MKTSASKIIKLWLNKLKLNKSKNYLNKQTISIGITTIFILMILFYFLRPVYFDYQGNKKFFENKIDTIFKLKMNIDGNISYKIFPTPRILVENVDLNFIKKNKRAIKIKKLYILISPLNLNNFQKIYPKKILVKNQEIKIYPVDFKNYFNYLTLHKEKTLTHP